MKPANIKEFRLLLKQTLEAQGFAEKKLEPKMPLAWALPAQEVLPIFAPHAMRRPWGFYLSGMVGIELLPLTRWMDERLSSPSERGSFRFWFAGYHMANDQRLNNFRAIFGEDVPIHEWVARIWQRLDMIPGGIDELIHVYRRAPDHLGWLAAPINKAAWDFLLRWRIDPAADLAVPGRLA